MTCLLRSRPIVAGMDQWSSFAGRMALVEPATVTKNIAHLSCHVPLRHFPSKLVYVASCRCWRLQQFVDMNPGGAEIKGTLYFPDEFTGIGEALVARDGLIHPDRPCESKSSFR